MKFKKLLRLTTSGLSLLVGIFAFGFFLENNNLVHAGAPLLGTGTSGDPFQISECSDLLLIQDNPLANYLVTADFSCSSITNWTPMGTFSGVLDGANHIISDIVNTGSREHNGFFSYISGATIKDLTITGINFPIEGRDYTGGLVSEINSDASHVSLIQNVHTSGVIYGTFYTGGLIGVIHGAYTTIDNCSSNVEVHGVENVGGLVGFTESPIINSHADGAVFGEARFANTGGLVGKTTHSISESYATGQVTGENSVGGLIGYQETSINLSVDNCYATGNVTGGHNDGVPMGNSVGGLIGYSRGPVTNSHATGNVINLNSTSNDGYGIGGLIGTSQDNTIIENCYATGTVDGNFSVGGLIGAAYNSVNISNSFATGNIGTIMSTGTRVGGLIGTSVANITNSYAMGNVTGSSDVGGFAGGHGWNGTTITYSFSKGSVTGTSSVGGMVGSLNGPVSTSYYDSETSGRSDNDGRGIPKTTTEMKTQSTYVDWNFSTIWHIDTLNDGYPYTTVSTSGLSTVSTVSSSTYTVSTNGTANEIISGVPVGVDKATFLAAITKNDPNQVWDDTNISDPLFSGNTLLVTAEDGVTTTTYFIKYIFSGLGEGTSISPFEITTCEQFHEMQNNLSSNYIVQNYIDCYDYIWTPIGNNPGVPFRGVLNGNNQTVGDILFATIDGGSFAGVFGDVEGATIKDITFEYLEINTPNYSMVGGLTGALELANPAGLSTIDNVHVSGVVIGGSMTAGLIGFSDGYNDVIRNSTTNVDVTGVEMTAGLIGQNYASIDNCYSAGPVNGGYRTGGLIGSSWNNYYGVTTYITNSHATGNVTATGSRSGGLVGDSAVSISNSYSTGAVNVTGDYAGGLVGFQYAGATGFTNLHSDSDVYATGNNVGGLFGNLTQSTLSDSYSTGSVTGLGGYTGGLIGNHYMSSSDLYTLTNTYATGDVTGGGYGYTGGLVGSASVPILSSYSTGNVIGSNVYIGGLVGSSYQNIENSHALGTVEGTGSYVGGLAGAAYNPVLNCYAEGIVTGIGDADTHEIGGLIGAAYMSVNNSYAKGNVIAYGADPDGRKYVGGLIGVAYTGNGIADSYALGNVTSTQGKYVGGLIGYHVGSGIARSFAIGDVIGNINVGGLVGGTIGTIVDTFATGDVTGTDLVGGLFGETFSTIDITNSYSKGFITGTTNTGGLVGLSGEDTTFNLAYYDTQTSGQTDTGKGIPKLTSEMLTQSTYTGWDLSTVWLMDSDINDGYPYQTGFPIILSNNATVSGFIYDISANGSANETIVGVLFGMSKTDFLAGLSKNNINQTWDISNINDPVVTGNTLVVTAQDGVTVVTYTISVDIQRVLTQIDINPGVNDSDPKGNPNKFAYIGNTLFFSSDDGVHGIEFWKSNAITGITELVKDIETGSNGSYPTEMINVGGVLYFTASDSVNGYGLWKSNGTNAGTTLVKGGIEMSYPLNVNGTLFFWANVAPYGKELWKSDGTLAGTVLVKDITDGTGSTNSGGFYAVARNSSYVFLINEQLWISDGTNLGTVMIKSYDAAAGTPININGDIFFVANDLTDGGELWKTDGTLGGTVRVKDIIPGTTGSWPSNLTVYKGELYFWASNSTYGTEFWKSDGTSDGTVKIEDASAYNLDSSVKPIVSGGKLYFVADDADWAIGSELWATNGIAGGTRLVKDIDTNSNTGSDIEALADVNGILYFSAHDNLEGGYNQELWRSNGSDVGTVMVQNIEPADGEGSYPELLINVNNTLFFSAWTNNEGTELYRYGAEIEAVDSILSALEVSDCTLDPVFNSATLSYSCTVDSSIGSVMITPTTNKPTSTITINGKTATTGTAFIQNIKPFENIITIIVTDAFGITTSTYTLTITKPTIIGASYYEYDINRDFGSQTFLEKPTISTIDKDDNIIIGGWYQNGPIDFDPGVGEAWSPADYNSFILKLNPQKQFVWVKFFKITFGSISGLDTDSSGNVLMAGAFKDYLDLDPSAAQVMVQSGNEGGNYIIKLDSNGNYIWGRADSYPIDEVGLWNFNETTDNSCLDGKDVCDSTGLNHNGELFGIAPIVATPNGYGRDFEGTNGTFVEVDDVGHFEGQQFTVEAYVKKEGVCNVFLACTILSKGSSSNHGFRFSIWNGRLEMRVNDVDELNASGSTLLNDDTWYYVSATVDAYNNVIKVYVNGVLDGVTNVTHYSPHFFVDYNSGNKLEIGNGNSNNDLPFEGVIDGVRYSNVVKDSTYFQMMNTKYSSGTGSDVGAYSVPAVSGVGGLGFTNESNIVVDSAGNTIIQYHSNLTGNYLVPEYATPIFSKFDSNGNLLWTRTFNNIGNSYFSTGALDLDSNGNLLIFGSISQGSVDFDTGLGEDIRAPLNNNESFFVTKLNSDGTYGWTKMINASDVSSYIGYKMNMHLDSMNNIILYSSFRGTVDFDPGLGSAESTSSNSTWDMFVLKLDSNGNYIWHKSIAGNSSDEPSDLAINLDDNIFISGTSSSNTLTIGTSTFDVPNIDSYADPFFIEMDSNGNYIFSRYILIDGTSHAETYMILFDSDDSMYYSGYYQNSIDFNIGETSINRSLYTAPTDGNMFLAKYIKTSGPAPTDTPTPTPTFTVTPTPVRPINDNFADALPIELNTPVYGNNVYATMETDEKDWSNLHQSLWWHYYSPEAIILTITSCGSDFDNIYAIYDTSVLPTGSATPITFADYGDGGDAGANDCIPGNVATLTTTAGTDYKIQFGGYLGTVGNIVLTLTGSPIPVAPEVLNVVVNSGSDITLNSGTTKNVLVTAQVTDNNGYSDISTVSTKLYYSAVTDAENCSLNNLNCYEASCTKNNCSGNSCDVSCSVDLQYFASPTDNSLEIPNTYWSAYLTATDNADLSSSEFSIADSPDVLSQMSFTQDKSSINYGTVLPGANTEAANQEISLINNGNVNFDTELYGTNMCKDFPTCSGTMVRILPTQQKFGMIQFTYSSGGSALQSTATAYQFNAEIYPNNTKTLYWGIAIPSIIGSGAHSGEVYINAINDF